MRHHHAPFDRRPRWRNEKSKSLCKRIDVSSFGKHTKWKQSQRKKRFNPFASVQAQHHIASLVPVIQFCFFHIYPPWVNNLVHVLPHDYFIISSWGVCLRMIDFSFMWLRARLVTNVVKVYLRKFDWKLLAFFRGWSDVVVGRAWVSA